MAVWLHRIEVSDLFHDDDLPFTEKRDAIVARIKAAPFYSDDCDTCDDALWWIVDEMADVENVEYFDLVWSAFYDWCDAHRVWVETWKVPA